MGIAGADDQGWIAGQGWQGQIAADATGHHAHAAESADGSLLQPPYRAARGTREDFIRPGRAENRRNQAVSVWRSGFGIRHSSDAAQCTFVARSSAEITNRKSKVANPCRCT